MLRILIKLTSVFRYIVGIMVTTLTFHSSTSNVWYEITTGAEIKLAYVLFSVLILTFDIINAYKVKKKKKKTDTKFLKFSDQKSDFF